MSGLQIYRLVVLAFLLGVLVHLAWPAIRNAMRKRNHRVSGVLGRPDPSCQRNYLP